MPRKPKIYKVHMNVGLVHLIRRIKNLKMELGLPPWSICLTTKD